MRKGKTPAHRSNSPGGRLDGWKAIASYLGRDVSTLHRWEKNEGLPVQRHLHEKSSTVYAHRKDLDAWWEQRGTYIHETGTSGRWVLAPRILKGAGALVVLGGLLGALWFLNESNPSPSLITASSFVALEHFDEADRHMRARRHVESEASLRAAIAADPEFAVAHTWLAWALRNQGRSEAEWMYWAQRGLQLAQHATEREHLHAQASLYMLTGRWEEAVPLYERILKINGQDYWAANNLLAPYRMLDKFEEARLLVFQLAEIYPSFETEYRAAWWTFTEIRKCTDCPDCVGFLEEKMGSCRRPEQWGVWAKKEDFHPLLGRYYVSRILNSWSLDDLKNRRGPSALLVHHALVAWTKQLGDPKLVTRAEEIAREVEAWMASDEFLARADQG